MKEKISVVLPIYRSQDYILDCLKSIVGQTYPPYELILVSDGCIDKSVEIARRFLNTTSVNFKIIEQTNQGVSSARNNGISHASGDWVIAIDSDDCIYPRTFELLMSNVKDEEVLTIDYETNRDMADEPVVEGTDIETLDSKFVLSKFYNREYKLVSPALMLKKSFLVDNAITYDVGCKFAEDDIYVWKVLCRANKILYIRKPLYNYIFHGESTMTSPNINKFLSVKVYSENLDRDYLQSLQSSDNLKHKILYRHYIGLLHAAAIIQSYPEFKSLIDHYEMKELFINRKSYYNISTKLFFSLPLTCPYLLYIFFKVR